MTITATPVLGPFPHAVQLRIPELLGAAPFSSSTELTTAQSAVLGQAIGDADTQGWDTVFAIRLTDVNRTLAKPGVSPPDWNIVLTPDLFFGSGSFGPWAAAQGGSAAILRMSAPITAGSVTFQALPYQLAGATVYFQVELTYIPQPNANATTGQNELKVKKTPSSPHAPTVVVDEVDYGPNPVPDTMGNALVIGALQKWFNDNIGDFEHIFTTVNLAAKADKDAFQWLMPTYTSYAYLDGPTMDNSFFGVLCMCKGHDPGTNPPQLSAGAIPSGARAGFSIAQEDVLEQMIMPAMVTAFDKADSTYLQMSNLDTQVTNTKNIPLDSVKYGAIYYDPEIQTLDATVIGGVLQIHTIIHVNISPGIDAYIETTSFKAFALAPQATGLNTLTFVDAKPATQNQWTDVAAWITITEAIVAIIGAIAGIVIGAMGQVAKWIVTAIIVAILFGVAALLPELIAKFTAPGVLDQLPPINDLLLSPTTAIKWPAGGVFNVTAAVMDGALVLGGDPNFS
jgi:hypothetical protein